CGQGLGVAGNSLRKTKASARSTSDRAVGLKSSLAGLRTAMYKAGFRNCRSELLSIKRLFGDESADTGNFANASRSNGNPSARKPCFVLSQNARAAPAARKRELSVPLKASVSQSNALECSLGAQPQCSPFWAQTPWPYWVIFPAMNFVSGIAVIR